MKIFLCLCISFSLHAGLPKVAGMTLEEKVGQLLVAHFQGENYNAAAETLLERAHVGGVIYYDWANGLTSPEQILALSRSLQEHARIPLFIACDQEGGAVVRLVNGFTYFPGNGALGRLGDLDLIQKCGRYMSQEAACVGVNLMLSPVVDVISSDEPSAIGVRSFGSDPNHVIRCARAFMHGMRQGGMITCLKHYPGLGQSSIDSHFSLPVTPKPTLEPFHELSNEADMIMTAHVIAQSLDPDHPATISKNALTFTLRKSIGFNGVIISDSLVMEGLLQICGNISEAAIQSLEAGCDLLILGGKALHSSIQGRELTPQDVLQIHTDIIQAILSGRLSEQAVDHSVSRIFQLKSRFSFLQAQALAESIAAQTVETIKLFSSLSDPQIVYPITPTPLYLPGIPISSDMPLDRPILLFTYQAWRDPAQQEFIKRLHANNHPYAAIILRDPDDQHLLSGAQSIIATRSPDPFSIRQALNILIEE